LSEFDKSKLIVMEAINNDELDTLLQQSSQPAFGNRKLLIRLLIAYRGTMSNRDQTILKVMMAHEDRGYTVRNVSPDYLFGKHYKTSLEKSSAAPEAKEAKEAKEDKGDKAVEVASEGAVRPHDESKAKKKPESPLSVFLKQFVPNTLRQTLLNVPSDLTLDNLVELKDWNLYDVRFLLPVFYHSLSNPDVHIAEFIDRHCLAITLSCLTVRSQQVRQSAYAVLSLFHRRCDDDYGHLWRLLLDRLQAFASQKPEEPLPYLIISCLVQIIPLIHRPNHTIYDELVDFLVNAPLLTCSRVLAFVRLLFDLNDRKPTSLYPKLGLAILRKGIRSEYDFTCCWNFGTIDQLMRSYHSPLIDCSLRPSILEVFERVCSLEKGAKSLLIERAFLLWLSQLLIGNSKNQLVLDRVKQILAQFESHDHDYYPLYKSELQLMSHTYLRLVDQLL
jgi:hypothetical protein